MGTKPSSRAPLPAVEPARGAMLVPPSRARPSAGPVEGRGGSFRARERAGRLARCRSVRSSPSRRSPQGRSGSPGTDSAACRPSHPAATSRASAGFHNRHQCKHQSPMTSRRTLGGLALDPCHREHPRGGRPPQGARLPLSRAADGRWTTGPPDPPARVPASPRCSRHRACSAKARRHLPHL